MEVHPLTYAEINLEALRRNYGIIQSAAGNTPVLAVVKADAYGHGANICARTLYACGCRFFGVANAWEAVALRDGLCKPDAGILILGAADPADTPLLIEKDITVALFSEEYADRLANVIPDGKKLKVHIKLDTGMNRIGFSALPGDADATCAAILAAAGTGKFSFDGIFTHFCCADGKEPPPDTADPMTEKQAERFTAVIRRLETQGLRFPVIHAANSAALLRYPRFRFDMVRAGIILYGITPSEEIEDPGFRPVMTFVTHVTQLHTVRAGESVGYGAFFTAPRALTVATLAAGYADGFIRAYAGGRVYFPAGSAPLVGRICMDQCMADVTSLPVSIGDRVVLFGELADGVVLPAAALAARAGSIPYETVCLVGKRVRRIYREEC